MRRDIRSSEDIKPIEAVLPSSSVNGNRSALPEVLSASELLAKELPTPEWLIESILPMRGACLLVGGAKTGKTILSTQMAVAVASGKPLFDYYRTLPAGQTPVGQIPTMLVEQDDSGSPASIQQILQRA